jgi:hypothetical protein
MKGLVLLLSNDGCLTSTVYGTVYGTFTQHFKPHLKRKKKQDQQKNNVKIIKKDFIVISNYR